MAYISLPAMHAPRSGNAVSRFARLFTVHQQRRQLADLDDAALADIGLTRAQANEEAARGFWDAPMGWRE
ncbi:hypothetical protein PRI8871_00962 [Pseudoprimorskyibacter insulae]|uniref:YjiS-like domain-containing protein n=2 Tax=Pseudoprimorskyibacter insulae TaxID=1695997 RepID=A0A2R8AQN5_9RHOB|nr:hypothetical protein PRI8871_00962 [Pseudoprimorskyibacter insulae]